MTLMEYLNARMEGKCDKHEEDLAVALVDRVLVNMAYHIMTQRRGGAGIWTWYMQQEWRQVMGRGEYILSTDRRKFTNMGMREPRYGTDHRIILVVLQVEGVLCNR